MIFAKKDAAEYLGTTKKRILWDVIHKVYKCVLLSLNRFHLSHVIQIVAVSTV